ncbi:hypothetical protein V6N13_027734 [Hibiscus sabdariffa]
MVSGFLAGTAGPVCTAPFDIVKTRLMAQSRDGGESKYKGMIHAIRTIYRRRRTSCIVERIAASADEDTAWPSHNVGCC